MEDSITEFCMQPNSIHGNYNKNSRYDLLSVIMVCLTAKTIDSENKLIGMLSNLLSSKLSVEEKKQALEHKYNILMTVEMEREVDIMCNLSYGIAEEATKEATLNTLASLVKDNLLTISEAAKRAEVSEAEFKELLNK